MDERLNEGMMMNLKSSWTNRYPDSKCKEWWSHSKKLTGNLFLSRDIVVDIKKIDTKKRFSEKNELIAEEKNGNWN